MLLKMYKKHCRAKLEKKFLPEVYTSLDELPIKIWWDINETGNINLLLKEKQELNENEIIILNENLALLVEDFVKRYGFSEQYKEIQEKKKEIVLHYIRLIYTEDKTEKTFIKILETEIKEIETEMSMNKQDNLDVKAYLDEDMGFSIDIRKCTVTEYMAYLKKYEQKHAA